MYGTKKKTAPDEVPLEPIAPDEVALEPVAPDEVELEAISTAVGLTSPSPIPHNPSVGASQPRPHGPIPTVERPQPEAAGVSSYPQRRTSAAPPQPIAQRSAFAPNQQIEILPSAGGISPLPPAPMPTAPIPAGLQGPPAAGRPGEFPRMGRELPVPGPMPGFQGVQPGLDQALRGFSRASFGTASAGIGAGPAQTTPTAQPQLDPDAWRPPTLTGRVGAAADTIEGLEQASAPYILPALVAGAMTSIPAAVTIGAGVVGGYAREEGVRKGLEYAGSDPRVAKFAGKVAGWWPESHIPGYTSAVSGAAEALLPNSPTKQFAGGLEESITGFNQLVDEVGKMDPSSPEYSQALTSLKSGEAQLGVAANTLAQANLLGAIKSAQVMGKMRSVPESAKADSLGEAATPSVSPDIIPLDQAMGEGSPSAQAEPKYKSGTTQYNLPEDLSARVQFLGESIPDSALAESGRATDPHLTIRYGIQDDPQVAIPKIRQALANQSPVTVRLGETSLFPDRGDGEVLKIDLDQSPELESIRAALAQSGIDHIPDKGDELGYSPHITVAYLKPGEGQNHIGPSPLTGQGMVIDRIWVGDRNGNQYEIPFGKSMEGILGPEGEAIRGMAGGESASIVAQPKFQIRGEVFHATSPEKALEILSSGQLRPSKAWAQSKPYISLSRLSQAGAITEPSKRIIFSINGEGLPGHSYQERAYAKTRYADGSVEEAALADLDISSLPEGTQQRLAELKSSDPDAYQDYLVRVAINNYPNVPQTQSTGVTKGKFEAEERLVDYPINLSERVQTIYAVGGSTPELHEAAAKLGIPVVEVDSLRDMASIRAARLKSAPGQFHVTQSGQPAASSPQLWTPEQLSKSLPGYKLDLLPNNEKANPGGATLGIETPSGKWAKLVVTRGRDLPTDPAAITAQLGRPAQPGDVVMGQYESRGLREQSVITLAGAAGPDTLDHELFHYAFDTFLTPQEQAAILSAHGSEEAAAIAYGSGQGGMDPGLGRIKKLFADIHNKFYPDSKATLESLRKGKIWERDARYGVDTRPGLYQDPQGRTRFNLGALADNFLETFDRNLVRFESNEPVYLAATLAAPGTSQSISREALISPAQEIARTMHAGGWGKGSLQLGWRAFAEILIDNRLAGVQGRWSDLATAIEKSTPKELRKSLARNSEGPDGPLARVLDRVEADQPMASGSRYEKVADFLAAKDYAGAKAYLAATFRHNAYAVKRLDLQGAYGKRLDEFAQDPQFRQALQVYKSKVEALFASHHMKNEGLLSADLGPLQTYYPLVPQKESGPMPLWQESARKLGYWIRPHNPNNYFTTGLATKGYDPELTTLRSRLTASVRGGNVKQFLDVMKGTGLAVKVTDPGAATATFRGGEELPVTIIPIGSAQSISVKGQALKIPPQYIAVPQALGATVKSIVLGEGPGGSSAFHSEGFIEDAINRITGWSLVGPADAAFHAQAVLSSLVAGTPYLQQSNAFMSFMANLPVAKAFTAMWTAYRKPAKWFTSPEGEKTLSAMAQGGMLNPRIGSVAWDKDYADLFGAEWKPPVWRGEAWRRTAEEKEIAKAGGLGAKLASYLDVAGRIGDLGTSAVVFGHPGEGTSRWLGLDLRARVSLYELHTKLFPDAPLPDRANFVNQAMQYNWGLQSQLEQYIKGYAGTRFTSVFFTAGYSMIRAGMRAMNPVGTRHGLNRLDPIGQQQLARAQRAFSGGITGMVGAWALINLGTTGKWPWDPDQEGGPVPLNSIALPDRIRQSAAGKTLMGDPAKGSPRQGYVPMGFFNAAVKKGLDVTGAKAGYDESLRLGPAGLPDPVGRQWIAQEALRSSMNTFLHPLTSGPIPRAGMAAMGMSPWIGPMWDPITGRNQFTFRTESRVPSTMFEAMGTGLARGAGQMSPFVNWANEAGAEAAIGVPMSGTTKRDDGAAWAKTLADIMVPRSRPVAMDAKAKAQKSRELVIKRKKLIQRQQSQEAKASGQ